MPLHQPSRMWNVHRNRQHFYLPRFQGSKEQAWVWFICSSIDSVMALSYLYRGPPHLEIALLPRLQADTHVGTAEVDHGLMLKFCASHHSSILRARISDNCTLLSPNAIECFGSGISQYFLQCPPPSTEPSPSDSASKGRQMYALFYGFGLSRCLLSCYSLLQHSPSKPYQRLATHG